MKTKKILLTVAAMAIVAVVAVSVTFAYLTSTASVTNTFTASANVKITLDEAKVDELGVKADPEERVTANTYKLIPKHTYVKDPTIHVDKDSDDCWVFAKIENNLGEEAAYALDTNIWEKVTGITEEVYVCKEAKKAEDNIVVFSTFTFDENGSVTSLTGYEGKTIVITGYAIQKDGFDTYTAAIEGAKEAFGWTPATSTTEP